MKSFKVLKNLPIVAVGLILLLNYSSNYFKIGLAPSDVAFYYFSAVMIVLLALAILPSLILIFEMLKNENFREKALKEEINYEGKDERESIIVAKAAQKAFASMHLSIWLTIVLFFPINMIYGGLFYLNLGGMDIGFVILLLIPLAVGNYTFHQNINELKNEKDIDKKKWLLVFVVLVAVIFIAKSGYQMLKDSKVGQAQENLNQGIERFCKEGNDESALVEVAESEGFKDVGFQMVDGKRMFHYGYMLGGTWGTTDIPVDSMCR